MPVKIDIVGKRFGKLIAIKLVQDGDANHRKYLCSCDCGKTKVVSEDNLKRGHTKTCGCRNKGTYGLSRTRIYSIWLGMINRCENNNMKNYCYYGGRGISVCKEWHNFQNFKEWSEMNGYKENLTIDRINNDGNYEPNNCRWITSQKQANNRRNSKTFTVNGKTHTIIEWAKIKKINVGTLRSRIWCRKWEPERAILTPSNGGL